MGGAFLAPIVTADPRTDTLDCTPGATKALADVAARTTKRIRYSIGAVCGATDLDLGYRSVSNCAWTPWGTLG